LPGAWRAIPYPADIDIFSRFHHFSFHTPFRHGCNLFLALPDHFPSPGLFPLPQKGPQEFVFLQISFVCLTFPSPPFSEIALPFFLTNFCPALGFDLWKPLFSSNTFFHPATRFETPSLPPAPLAGQTLPILPIYSLLTTTQ